MDFAGKISCDALACLLPDEIVVAELWNIDHDFPLYADEARCVAQAVPKRLREFSAGRFCARYALKRLGISEFPLLIGPDRCPRWPDILVGSITHTSNYCCVAVGKRSRFSGIGIDAESIDRVREIAGPTYSQCWDDIFTSNERGWLQALPLGKRIEMIAAIFSAKEAFYKCQYQITRQFMNFTDVEVQMGTGIFNIQVIGRNHIPGGEKKYPGRFSIDQGLVMTATTISA